jgi:hypothetical protein
MLNTLRYAWLGFTSSYEALPVTATSTGPALPLPLLL